jgi:hypothetical protein
MTVAEIHTALGSRDLHDNTLRNASSTMTKAGQVNRDKRTGQWSKSDKKTAAS